MRKVDYWRAVDGMADNPEPGVIVRLTTNTLLKGIARRGDEPESNTILLDDAQIIVGSRRDAALASVELSDKSVTIDCNHIVSVQRAY